MNIAPIDDNIIEPNEVFAITLRDEPPVAGINAGPDLSLTIVDNDSPVVNRPPTTVIRGPATGVSNQPLKFLLIARDADPVDQAANFTFVIAWGDGTTDTVVGPSGTSVVHAFQTADPDCPNGHRDRCARTVGQSDTTNVLIRESILTGMDLVIGGTPENDIIVFQPIDLVGNVRTIINGKDQGISMFAASCSLAATEMTGSSSRLEKLLRR